MVAVPAAKAVVCPVVALILAMLEFEDDHVTLLFVLPLLVCTAAAKSTVSPTLSVWLLGVTLTMRSLLPLPRTVTLIKVRTVGVMIEAAVIVVTPALSALN